jgi:hypothetical protein
LPFGEFSFELERVRRSRLSLDELVPSGFVALEFFSRVVVPVLVLVPSEFVVVLD